MARSFMMKAQTYLQEKLLKAPQVAEILNISRAMAYRLIQIGEIRSVQIGAARRVRQEDLDLYIEVNLTPGIEVTE
jgi:excisionase family DNA binding protein